VRLSLLLLPASSGVLALWNALSPSFGLNGLLGVPSAKEDSKKLRDYGHHHNVIYLEADISLVNISL